MGSSRVAGRFLIDGKFGFAGMVMAMIIAVRVSSSSAAFNLKNNCPYTVWPATTGTALLAGGGFTLQPGQSYEVSAPQGAWSGRFWGRTGCSFDQSGRGVCATGDCGGLLACAGAGGQTPSTLAEFTLAGSDDNNGATQQDFYDVSLVDGYNLPMLVVPSAVGSTASGSSGNCESAGCAANLNGGCPQQLQRLDTDGHVVACLSACEAFGSPEYCCTGSHSTPETCQPSSYAQLFKAACPTAYSYAYDDPTSTFTCTAASQYTITFCP